MRRFVPVAIAALLLAAGLANSALAQKRGGTLRVYFFDSPATMSVHEEFDDRRSGSGDGRVQ